MSAQVERLNESTTRDAIPTDCYRIFSEEMDGLYVLAFLLTADQSVAEQCCVTGSRECVNGFGVVLDDPLSAARSAIVRSAIGILRPTPQESTPSINATLSVTAGVSNPFASIVSLPAFERFVFVMSILEGQSDETCQRLLSCAAQEVVTARESALKRIGTGVCRFPVDHKETSIWSGVLN